MVRDPLSRPVSGEILTRRPIRGGNEPDSERDIVEAEYETVVSRYQKLDRAISESASGESSLFGLDILSGDAKESRGGKAGPVFWLLCALLVGAAFWISGGHTLLQVSNFKTSSVQPNPLSIEDVHSRMERSGAENYLRVDGSVTNSGQQPLPLPDLIIQVKLVDGSITRYRIAGGTKKIIAGGRYVFSSRLGAPNEGVENVKVIMQGAN